MPELLDTARATLASVTDASLHERALSYLYLSETRSSFEIERERSIRARTSRSASFNCSGVPEKRRRSPRIGW